MSQQLSPIQQFQQWFRLERQQNALKIPQACCLSTTGLDGFPNSRFVSLKAIVDDKFVITGSMNSRKSQELLKTPKAALTFWWTETEKQVRIQGQAATIDMELAKEYFESRNRAAKLVSVAFEQGQPLTDLDELASRFALAKEEWEGREVERPAGWAGFFIDPIRIEFLSFRQSRLHERELFTKTETGWHSEYLQP